MVLWIGVDDTDSLQGMCTTFLATEIVRELTWEHDLIGFPRLVRLNPNIPWKTRGNGAVCIRIGQGTGPVWQVGRIGGREIRAYARCRGMEGPAAIEDTVASLVERWSRFDEEKTNPGFALLRRQPSPRFYWRAVRDVVTKSEAFVYAEGLGIVRGYKNGRGVIGAVAAISWRPRDRTYEILEYRHPSRWGTPRVVGDRSVIRMDRRFPSTFNNYDYENRRVVIAPRSPCPVLFGIRGDDPGSLTAAALSVRTESPERWLIFETNQGTDDHVRRDRRKRAWSTVRFQGTVESAPRTIPGGHVILRIANTDVTAYEPSKQFRRIVRALVAGDLVEVIGSVRKSPQTINLEKIHIVSLRRLKMKVANPLCTICNVRMKSAGRDAPYRCRGCGGTAARSRVEYREILRSLTPTWYEPPVGSRRHLSKPLQRGIPR